MMKQPRSWVKLGGKGLIFLQPNSSLIEKRLGVGEEIQMNYTNLFCYSNTVTVSRSTVEATFKNSSTYNWCPVKCKGPGVVFIECQGSGGARENVISKTIKVFLVFFIINIIVALLETHVLN